MRVRPHLETCVQAWTPWTDSDINLLESVQVRAVRMTSGLCGTTYIEKLRDAKMMTLVERRERGDMIETWKLFSSNPHSRLLLRASDLNSRDTRGTTSLALVKESRINLDQRRNFFTNRVVNPWNSLPLSIKTATSLESFKSRYDKHMFNF